MGIEVKNISKKFGEFTALKDVNLEVKSGELLALLGPSGSGKTTLLRIIAGLEFADNGAVILNGEEAHDKRVKERDVGFVFQHYALFKHMTVYDNVAFGLKVRPKKTRPPEDVIRKKVMDLLKLVHLDAFHDRYPTQLSGGQRQRVALARALAVEPKVLLLDEPFGALDAKVRKELRVWMRRLHDSIHITSVFVTHDQEEAMEVADRVVVMSNGKIEQVGTPEQVYHHPSNSFVYDFLGKYNEFEGWKDESGVVHLSQSETEETVEEKIKQETEGSFFKRHPEIANIVNKIIPNIVPEPQEIKNTRKQKVSKKYISGKPVKIYARPHEMWITKTLDEHEYISAKVIHINPAGPLVKLELERKDSSLLQVEVPKSVIDLFSVTKGDTIYTRPKAFKVFE